MKKDSGNLMPEAEYLIWLRRPRAWCASEPVCGWDPALPATCKAERRTQVAPSAHGARATQWVPPPAQPADESDRLVFYVQVDGKWAGRFADSLPQMNNFDDVYTSANPAGRYKYVAIGAHKRALSEAMAHESAEEFRKKLKTQDVLV